MKDEANTEINGKIYCVTNSVNGKKYIGQTKRSVEARWKQHVRLSQRSSHYFHRAINKYGIDAFAVSTLVTGVRSADELDVLERKFIIEYRTLSEGYNLTTGGEGGYTRSDSTIQKISGANNHMYGKTHSVEARRKISEKATGRKQSEERKEASRTRMLGNKISSRTFLADFSKNRADKTIYAFYHPAHGVVKGYVAEVAGMYKLRTGAVWALIKGTYASTNGWVLAANVNTVAVRNATHRFRNVYTQKEVFCTCVELAKLCNVDTSTIQRLVNSSKKQTRQGWEFIKEDYNG